jgi:hypothetical protein
VRLTRPPLEILDDGFEDPYRERPQQILQYLAKKDSSVELLAFSPTLDDCYTGEADSNGHTRPHYYYLRDVSSTMLPKNKHHAQTLAVPVKKADIAQYIEEP